MVKLAGQLEKTAMPDRVVGITECQKRPTIRQSIEVGNINYHPAACGKDRDIKRAFILMPVQFAWIICISALGR